LSRVAESRQAGYLIQWMREQSDVVQVHIDTTRYCSPVALEVT